MRSPYCRHGASKHDVAHLELARPRRTSSSAMRPTARRSDAAASSSAIVAAGAAITALSDGGLLRRLRVGLRAPDADEREAREPSSSTPASPRAARSSTVGHDGAVHRAVVRPAPRLFGRERDDGREQPQQHVERGPQRGDGRGLLGARLAVGALLDELEVVVAERPEERLGRPRGRGRGRSRRTPGGARRRRRRARRACCGRPAR